MPETIAKLNMHVLYSITVGAAISIIAFAVSILAIGFSSPFAIGALAGLFCGSICVYMIKIFLSIMVDKRKSAFSLFGFLVRIVIFSATFYSALMFGGYEGGLGCAIGFVAPYFGASCIQYTERLHAKIKGDSTSCEHKFTHSYDSNFFDANGNRRFVFVKSFDTVCYKNGRKYITHRMFQRLVPTRNSTDTLNIASVGGREQNV